MRISFSKILILLIILPMFLLGGMNAYAQKKPKKSKADPYRSNPNVIMGDKYFSVLEYIKAAEQYKKAYDSDSKNHYALYKLAESYRMYFDYYNAEKYYKEAANTATKDFPLSRYWYAILLKDNGNYLQAKEQFNTFRSEYVETSLEAELYKEKALQEAAGCDHAIEELKKPQRNYEFKPLPSPVNSDLADVALVISENDTTVAITSSRLQSTGKTEGGIGGSLTDVFRFKKGTGDEWIPIQNDQDGFGVMNSPFNDATGSYTADYSKFYFTRCDEKVKAGEFIDFNCGIYVSYFKNGKWEKPIKLNENINMPGQWNAQPSVSPDGHLLFFVSRRPGGIGMHDIWYSTSSANENWSKAQNMGDKVNTLFSDISPRYYGKEKMLFFSSNGRQGFGGQDIFFVHEDQLDSIRNIGLPFNSNRDDSYFVLGEKKGYVTSNREGGLGNFDIYTFNIESKESLIAYINNDTAKSVKSISVVGTLTDQETKLPAVDVGVILADDNSNKLKTSTTNDSGNFRFDNLPTNQNYKVLLQEEDAKITKQVKYIVDNVTVKGSDKNVSKVLFENIYFDFDKYDLKPEATKVLDNLWAFYTKNPEIQIEMSAFTDSYGTSEYNKALSINRGNNALKYLISKGVDKAALVVTAEGEGKPVASNATQIGRQLNRRVEFFILGGPGYTANVSSQSINPKDKSLYYVAKQFNMSIEELESYIKHEKLTVSDASADESATDYYVVQPKNTLFSIARLYGTSVAELREINKINPTQALATGQKLKIKLKDQTPSDVFYLVKPGDTLYSISKQFGLTVEQLVKINAMEGYILRKNMILKIKG